MAATETLQIPLGFKAPDFKLLDTVTGKMVTLNELKSDVATVVMFICNHCPYVKHINKAIVQMANDYQPKGISFIAISSNDVVNYPADDPKLMKVNAQEEGYAFPYLYDETQEVAKSYFAACTPDFSVFNKDLLCVYRGQLDDSRPGNSIAPNGKDIRNALDAILNKQPISEVQKPSIGCNIKWK